MTKQVSGKPQWIWNGAGSAAAVLSILGGLLLLQQFTPLLPAGGAPGLVRDAVAEGRGRNPIWWAELRQANTGYYEALMSRSSDPNERDRTFLSRLWTEGQPVEIYQDDPFLGFVGRPNLNNVDPVEGPQVTNSQGLFDAQEHVLGRSPNTRRVAVLGDSITRGWGMDPSKSYTALVETRLDREVAPKIGKEFEFINFSVTAYRITQLYGTALEIVPKYKPDVYLFMLSELTAAPDWASHLLQLFREGKDLRYDFLKEAIQVSGLKPGDSAALAQKKLAPYKLGLIREALQRLKAHTDKEGAELMIVLVTASEDTELVRTRFEDLLKLLEQVDIPVVSLLDSFKDVQDIETMRRFWYDAHPNEEGHRRLAETFLSGVKAQPKAWKILTGLDEAQ